MPDKLTVTRHYIFLQLRAHVSCCRLKRVKYWHEISNPASASFQLRRIRIPLSEATASTGAVTRPPHNWQRLKTVFQSAFLYASVPAAVCARVPRSERYGSLPAAVLSRGHLRQAVATNANQSAMLGCKYICYVKRGFFRCLVLGAGFFGHGCLVSCRCDH